MTALDHKILKFIDDFFLDIDYSILGKKNQNEPKHKMALCYEYFVNSLEYYSHQKRIDSEDIKQISTGDMRGIDGCFFILNKHLFFLADWDINQKSFVDWKKIFDEQINNCTQADIDFYFFQSKSSEMKLSELNSFSDAVYDVFSEEKNDLSNNLKVKTLKYVYSESCKKDGRRNLKLKFCSISKDSKQIENLIIKPDWKSSITKIKKDLKSTKFDDVKVEIKSGQDYQDELEAILSPNKRSFEIKEWSKQFTNISNETTECYIGYLDLFQLKGILQSDTGNLDDVFFDNIRYFIAESDVNDKISKSLNSDSQIFHNLHNGIAITAHSKFFNTATGALEIKSFSVINGCQTCNLIWKWIENEKNKLPKNDPNDNTVNEKVEIEFENRLKEIKIPAKIIITSDPKLRAKITETANTQNKVESIQLIAVSEVAKRLEELFEKEEVRVGDKIYYERLSNQHPEVSNTNKINTEYVLRAFYSTFKKVPHKLTVGYGEFEKEKLKTNDFLFAKNNGESKYDLSTYYTSSLLFNYLERRIKSQFPSLVSLRHHLLLLLCISIDKDFEKINSEDTFNIDFLNKVKIIISDKNKFNERIDKICKIAISNFDFFISTSTGKPKVKPKSYYSEEGTDKMLRKFKEIYFHNASNTITKE